MSLANSSQDDTAMSTPLGLMRWKAMPMGVKNGNAQFQRMTGDILRDLDCAEPFVNYVIVSSRTLETTNEGLIESHFVNHCKVVEVLHKHQLTRNGAEAVLFATEVEFARQVVGHGIHRPIPRKLAFSPTEKDVPGVLQLVLSVRPYVR